MNSCAASSVRSVSAVQVSGAAAGGVAHAGFDVTILKLSPTVRQQYGWVALYRVRAGERPTGGALEIGARVLHALVHERDVLRVYPRGDAERDPDRVGRSGDRHRAVGVKDEHLPEDADVLEPGGALDEWPHVQAVRAGK